MLTKTRAIVLSTLKYGERKIFVDMFSEEYGIITFAYSIPSRSRSGTKMNYLQPLNIVEVEFDRKPKVDIHVFRDIRIEHPAMSIPFDPYKLSISLFLAEFLKYALINEQKNEPLFLFIKNSIEWLDAARGQFANFHIIFMMRISRFIGFFPNVDSYSPGQWFDLRDGSFTHSIPPHKQVIQPTDASIIPVLARLTYGTMHLLKLSRTDRNKCTEEILTYYRLHLPHFPELRSFDVMRELFI